MHSSLTRRLTGVAVVFAALAFTVSAFAQYGGLTGKCTGEDGKPLVGYTVKIVPQNAKKSLQVKTDKKGTYTYIGLYLGDYNIALLDPNGRQVFNINNQHVALGDPTELDIDLAKEKARQAGVGGLALDRLENLGDDHPIPRWRPWQKLR